MWRHIIKPESLQNFEISEYGIIRDISTKTPLKQYINGKGYPCVRYKYIDYYVHILVALCYIGDIPKKMEVHHKDFNKLNPYYKNLVICTRKQHRRYHASSLNPIPYDRKERKMGVTVLTEKNVHDICKLLEKQIPYPIIREKLALYSISDDCIGKIARGENWTSISSQYNIKTVTRAHMNSYSKDALKIAIMLNRGYTIKEIAEAIHVDVSNKTEYNNLYKCAKRYHKKLQTGEWGLIKRADANRIISG